MKILIFVYIGHFPLPYPKRVRAEAIFIPINPKEGKLCPCGNTRGEIVAVNNPVHDVLDAFRMLSNKNMILRDSEGRKYQLLTLMCTGIPMTFQRFVVSNKYRMYRVGTKEPNI